MISTEATAAGATARTFPPRTRLILAATTGIAVSTLTQTASAKVSADLGANTAVAGNNCSRINAVDAHDGSRRSCLCISRHTMNADLFRGSSNLFRCRRRKQIPLCPIWGLFAGRGASPETI